MTKGRVLYIDDDEGLRHLTERALRRRGFEVATAPGGRAGIARATAEPFDLIAVDHYMPGLDGLETLDELRKVPDLPPVIYVTGSEESKVAVAALKAGAADYVVKTIGEEFFDLLATAFAQALDHRRLRSEKAEAEKGLRAANARLEVLLKEMNHRIANSLQIVSAFVQMQATIVPNEAARTALKETQNRISAIAQVHRRLYGTDDVDAVDLADYLAGLLEELEETWSTPASPRRLTLRAEHVRLHPDRAVSLGVIVNELVSNACKYAYEPQAFGEVRVVLAAVGPSRFTLAVEDDGAGFSAADQPLGTGLGATLVKAMARNLGAAVAYERTGGGFRAAMTVEC